MSTRKKLTREQLHAERELLRQFHALPRDRQLRFLVAAANAHAAGIVLPTRAQESPEAEAAA